MRLRDIQGILRDNINALSVEGTPLKGMAPPVYQVTRGRLLHEALEAISVIPGLGAKARTLADHPAFVHPSDPLRVSEENFSQLKEKLPGFKERVHHLLETLDAALPPQHEHSISIRIPDPSDLNALVGLVGRLQKVFEQPARRAMGGAAGAILFQNFDIGSQWIELIIETRETLSFVFELATFGFLVLDKRKEHRRAEEERRRLNLSDETLKKENDDLRQALVRDWVAQLHERYKNNDNEAMNASVAAVNEWSDLLEEGATVKPALNAPKQIRDTFADPEPSKMLENVRQLLLTAPNGDGTDEAQGDTASKNSSES